MNVSCFLFMQIIQQFKHQIINHHPHSDCCCLCRNVSNIIFTLTSFIENFRVSQKYTFVSPNSHSYNIGIGAFCGTNPECSNVKFYFSARDFQTCLLCPNIQGVLKEYPHVYEFSTICEHLLGHPV